MKKGCVLICLALLLDSACKKAGSQDQKNPGVSDSVVLESESASEVRSVLIIHGSDVWVRDAPITGEVIMKLQGGDSCNVVGHGVRDTIRDIPGWWYKIEFQGKPGWVFGSQTSWKDRAELTIEPAKSILANDDSNAVAALIDISPRKVWQRLLSDRLQVCSDKPRTRGDEENFSVFECELGPDSVLVVRRWDDFDEWYSETYRYQVDTVLNLWISGVEGRNGSGSYIPKSIVGCHFENWQLNGIIDGHLEDWIVVNRDTTFLAFVAGWARGNEGQDLVDLWAFSKKLRTLTKLQSIPLPMWFDHPDNEAITHLESAKFTFEDDRILMTIHKMRSVDLIYEWHSSSGLFEELPLQQ